MGTMRCAAAGLMLAAAGALAEDLRDPELQVRQQAWLERLSERDLPLGTNTGTWVDAERWCVAHACLATGVRLEEANQYLAAVAPVSLWRGLVADTDVQVTDLLRTYLEFRATDRLTPAARSHLEAFFRDWRVPNVDRNRDADTRYEWPAEYTENHSLNILTARYLIDAALDRDRAGSRRLLQQFLFDRSRYGWSEFHSPSYLLVTAKALTCLADLAPDAGVGQLAAMHLDILMLEYSLQCLHEWRGVPFVRGYGSQVDNSRSSALPMAGLWWGGPEFDTPQDINPHMTHLLTSRYAPPALARSLAQDPVRRGRYTMRMLGTTGPGRMRVPMVVYVTPEATMASAPGSGSYYDGCYWTISFASAPQDVITGTYPGGRNLLQVDNVLAVFGSTEWRGSLKRETNGNQTVCLNGKAFVGQVDVGEDCHVFLLMDDLTGAAIAPEDARKQLDALQAKWANGVVSWTMPDGRRIRMINQRDGRQWRLVRATANDQDLRWDHHLLFDSPFLRSVRESGIYECVERGKLLVYDFRKLEAPLVRLVDGEELKPLPPDVTAGPAGLEMVYIPSGEFPMGSPLTEGRAGERPQRWLFVKDFSISRTEVTVAQYRQYLDANPDAPRPPDWYREEWGKTDQHAMTWVTAAEASAFCKWLSEKAKRTYRLPTETEWEKAAKGFSHRVYPWGDAYDGSQAGTPNGTYGPVGTHPADISPFGVLDMAGGVWEWCVDDADAKSDEGDRMQPLRSCGWNFDPDTFRCSYRSRAPRDTRAVHIGFRVVCEQP